MWCTVINLGWKGTRLDNYMKPTQVTVTHIDLNNINRRINIDVRGTKMRRGSGLPLDSNYASLTRFKDECEYFHDQKVIEVANQIGQKDFLKKQNMFKKLIMLPPPIDEELNLALDWHDTLSEQEKGFIKKLIEMERRA